MNIERCCKNEKNKMLKSLLNIPENIVISIGPTGCLNVLYNEAIKENKLGNLYTFPVSEIDMVSANHIEKLEKYIVKIISENFEKNLKRALMLNLYEIRFIKKLLKLSNGVANVKVGINNKKN